MHRDFLTDDFQLIGSNYFFQGIPDFTPHDFDYGKYQDNVPFFKDGLTCHTIKDGNCYFIWKKLSPEDLMDTAFKKSPMAAGKFLIPELNNQVGITINHIKALKPIFDVIDEKHSYEKIIYESYLRNNGFYLTEDQRYLAFSTYKKYSPNYTLINSYQKDKSLKLIIYSVRPKKHWGKFNKYGRQNSILGTLLVKNSEREEALNLYKFFQKSYPDVCAYESVNSVSELNYLNKDFNIDLQNSGGKVSYDFDFLGNFKWSKKISDIFKKEFEKNGIHCDLQVSPHGVHFISDKSNENIIKKVGKSLHNILIGANQYIDDFIFDIAANVKILDGIDIDGFKVETIKNWT